MTNTAPGGAADADGTSALRRFMAKFSVLKDAIPELWIIFAIKFLSIAAYGVTNLTLVLWLRSDLGYADPKPLQLVAAWSILMTVTTLLVGSLTDVLGMRRTLFLGTGICIFARLLMTLTTVHWLALGAGLIPLAVGEALGGPVLIAAVRHYSNTRQRSISFSIIYVMMNLGFLIANWLFDHFRQGLGEYGHWDLLNLHLSTYRTLFLASLILEIMILPFIYMMREGAEATDEGLKLTPPQPKQQNRNIFASVRRTISDSCRDTVQLFAKLLRESGFYRLLVFLLLIAFLKIILMEMYYVYPTFGIRELGAGAPVATLWNINSVVVILLVPIVGALTQRFSAYTMVVVGGLITVASVFVMAMPTALFAPLATGWLGNLVGHSWLGLQGNVHPYYVMIPIFVILYSVGESFYSPRVYEYAAAIAPKGQEASYGALSYVPLLLAKLLIGTFLSSLLVRYCPETGPRHSNTMWLIVGLTSLVAPLGLLTLRRFIRVQEAGRDDQAP
ncbi:MAG TPA: MFS transporter [Verrucomicrobiae bacterium]|jgi:MFS family permease|nr:MFS transporter [Verrucomicrobiae bacterium]